MTRPDDRPGPRGPGAIEAAAADRKRKAAAEERRKKAAADRKKGVVARSPLQPLFPARPVRPDDRADRFTVPASKPKPPPSPARITRTELLRRFGFLEAERIYRQMVLEEDAAKQWFQPTVKPGQPLGPRGRPQRAALQGFGPPRNPKHVAQLPGQAPDPIESWWWKGLSDKDRQEAAALFPGMKPEHIGQIPYSLMAGLAMMVKTGAVDIATLFREGPLRGDFKTDDMLWYMLKSSIPGTKEFDESMAANPALGLASIYFLMYPAGRVASIAGATTTAARVAARAGTKGAITRGLIRAPWEGVKRSYRGPDIPRLLHVQSTPDFVNPIQGAFVPISWPWHPVSQLWAGVYDDFSRARPFDPWFGENVRGARAQRNILQRSERRDRARASNLRKAMETVVFGRERDVNDMRLVTEAHAPPGMEPRAYAEAVLQDLRDLATEPAEALLKRGYGPDSPRMKQAKAREARLASHFQRMRQKRAQSIADAAVAPIVSPLRTQAERTLRKFLPRNQVTPVLAAMDAVMRGRNPDNPAAAWEARFSDFSFEHLTPELESELRRTAQAGGVLLQEGVFDPGLAPGVRTLFTTEVRPIGFTRATAGEAPFLGQAFQDVFYGNLRQALEGLPGEAPLTVKQVRQQLKAQQVGKNEVYHTGISQMLERAEAEGTPLSKEGLLEQLATEPLEVQEVLTSYPATKFHPKYAGGQYNVTPVDPREPGVHYYELVLRDPGAYGTRYKEPHWGLGGEIAHMRFAILVDKDGSRVMYLDELQSTLHQARAAVSEEQRQRRFSTTEADLDARLTAARNRSYEWNNEGWRRLGLEENPDDFTVSSADAELRARTGGDYQRYLTLRYGEGPHHRGQDPLMRKLDLWLARKRVYERAIRDARDAFATPSGPELPFEGEWVELLLMRALNIASDLDLDTIDVPFSLVQTVRNQGFNVNPGRQETRAPRYWQEVEPPKRGDFTIHELDGESDLPGYMGGVVPHRVVLEDQERIPVGYLDRIGSTDQGASIYAVHSRAASPLAGKIVAEVGGRDYRGGDAAVAPLITDQVIRVKWHLEQRGERPTDWPRWGQLDYEATLPDGRVVKGSNALDSVASSRNADYSYVALLNGDEEGGNAFLGSHPNGYRLADEIAGRWPSERTQRFDQAGFDQVVAEFEQGPFDLELYGADAAAELERLAEDLGLPQVYARDAEGRLVLSKKGKPVPLTSEDPMAQIAKAMKDAVREDRLMPMVENAAEVEGVWLRSRHEVEGFFLPRAGHRLMEQAKQGNTAALHMLRRMISMAARKYDIDLPKLGPRTTVMPPWAEGLAWAGAPLAVREGLFRLAVREGLFLHDPVTDQILLVRYANQAIDNSIKAYRLSMNPREKARAQFEVLHRRYPMLAAPPPREMRWVPGAGVQRAYGYAQEYDVAIPSILERLTRAYGGVVRPYWWKQPGPVRWNVLDYAEGVEGMGPGGLRGATPSITREPLPVHRLRLTPAIKEHFRQAQRLPQIRGGIVKGAAEILANKQVRLRFFDSADISTALHEFMHAALYDLPEDALTVLEGIYGKRMSEWGTPELERFARDGELYMTRGIAPNGNAKPFRQIAKWMRAIYHSSRAIDTSSAMDPFLVEVYDRLFGKPLGQVRRDRALRLAEAQLGPEQAAAFAAWADEWALYASNGQPEDWWAQRDVTAGGPIDPDALLQEKAGINNRVFGDRRQQLDPGEMLTLDGRIVRRTPLVTVPSGMLQWGEPANWSIIDSHEQLRLTLDVDVKTQPWQPSIGDRVSVSGRAVSGTLVRLEGSGFDTKAVIDPGTWMERLDVPPIFYSKARELIEDKWQGRTQTREQVRAMLKTVKDEEMVELGLAALLEEGKPKLTKAEVLAAIDNSSFGLYEEVRIAGDQPDLKYPHEQYWIRDPDEGGRELILSFNPGMAPGKRVGSSHWDFDTHPLPAFHMRFHMEDWGGNDPKRLILDELQSDPHQDIQHFVTGDSGGEGVLGEIREAYWRANAGREPTDAQFAQWRKEILATSPRRGERPLPPPPRPLAKQTEQAVFNSLIKDLRKESWWDESAWRAWLGNIIPDVNELERFVAREVAGTKIIAAKALGKIQRYRRQMRYTQARRMAREGEGAHTIAPLDIPFKHNWWVRVAMRRLLRYAADNDVEEIHVVSGHAQLTRYNMMDVPGGNLDWEAAVQMVDRSDYQISRSSGRISYGNPNEYVALPGGGTRRVSDWPGDLDFEDPDYPYVNVDFTYEQYGAEGEPSIEIVEKPAGDGERKYWTLYESISSFKEYRRRPDFLSPSMRELLDKPWLDFLDDAIDEDMETYLDDHGFNEAVTDVIENWVGEGGTVEAVEAQPLPRRPEVPAWKSGEANEQGMGLAFLYEEMFPRSLAEEAFGKRYKERLEPSRVYGRYVDSNDRTEEGLVRTKMIKLTEEDRARFREGLPLWQMHQNSARGAFSLIGDQHRLKFLDGADLSTWIHEFSHSFLFDLSSEQRALVEAWVNANLEHVTPRNRAAHEKWATAVERWVRDGSAPTKKLEPVMEKLSAWMQLIYPQVAALADPPPELTTLLATRFGREAATEWVHDVSARLAYPGETRVERYGGALSVARDEVQALERRAARREALQTLRGLRAERDKLVARLRRGRDPDLETRIARIEAKIEEMDARQKLLSDRRQRLLARKIDLLERSLKEEPSPEHAGVVAAMRELSQWTEEILVEAFGDEYRAIFEDRRGRLSQRLLAKGLIEDATPSDIFITHRNRPLGVKGSLLPSSPRTTTLGKTRISDLNLNKQNKLLLYQMGDWVTDPRMIFMTWMKAQSISYLNEVKAWLGAVGAPVPVEGPLPGWYLVNPKGRALPSFWKSSVDELLPENEAQLFDGLKGYVESFIGKPGEDAPLRGPDGNYLPDVVQVDPMIVKAFFGRMPEYTGRVSPIGNAADLTNALVKTSLIYMNPGYIPSNLLGNLVFLGLHQFGFGIPNLYRSGKALLRDKELANLILAEVGTGPTEAIVGERLPGQSRVTRGVRDVEARVAHAASMAADAWPRMASWYFEARKRGYKTREQQIALLKEGKQKRVGDRDAISSRATEAMVNFDRLAPWERRTISRVFFVWPWIRGSIGWVGWYARNYPERALLLMAGAKWYEQEHGDDLGKIPTWYQGVPWGVEGKTATVSNVSSISPFSTSAEALETVTGMGRGLLQGEPYPEFRTPWDYVNPVIDLAVQGMMGRNRFGGDASLQEVLQEGLLEDRSGVIPLYHFIQQMIDPSDKPPSFYLEQGRLAEFKRRVFRFAPQEIDLAQLQSRVKDEPMTAAEAVEKEVEDARTWWEKTRSDPFPQEVARAFAMRAEFKERAELLKEEIEKQEDYRRLGGKRTKLTQRQEAAIKAQILANVYPVEWARRADLIARLLEEGSPEAVRRLNSGLEAYLWGILTRLSRARTKTRTAEREAAWVK